MCTYRTTNRKPEKLLQLYTLRKICVNVRNIFHFVKHQFNHFFALYEIIGIRQLLKRLATWGGLPMIYLSTKVLALRALLRCFAVCCTHMPYSRKAWLHFPMKGTTFLPITASPAASPPFWTSKFCSSWSGSHSYSASMSSLLRSVLHGADSKY